MHPPRIAALALILGVVVSGCTPTTPPSMPTSTVTVPTCTPEFGGDPYPCTQAEYAQNQQTKARYAEAERVYREFTKLNNRELVERRVEPSPELRLLTGGSRASSLAEIRTQALANASYAGELEVVWLRPVAHRSGMPGNLAMLACADYTHWVVTFADGSPSPTGRHVARVEFDDAAGKTTIVEILREEAVPCD